MKALMPYRVLVAEDEEGIRLGLEDYLHVAGYEVETVVDGEEALQSATQRRFDAIILDLILPERDGLSVCKELRNQGIETPVLMLTAKTELEDMLRGFSVGGDDYLTKPFRALELLARLRALLKRGHSQAAPRIPHSQLADGLYADPTTGIVWLHGKPLALAAKEHALLLYFMAHPGETLTRDRLLKEVWNSELGESTRTIDVRIASLRKKIEEDPERPRRIQTVFGEGYAFVCE